MFQGQVTGGPRFKWSEMTDYLLNLTNYLLVNEGLPPIKQVVTIIYNMICAKVSLFYNMHHESNVNTMMTPNPGPEAELP